MIHCQHRSFRLVLPSAVLVALTCPQMSQAQLYGRGWNGYGNPGVSGAYGSGVPTNYGNGFGAYSNFEMNYGRGWNGYDVPGSPSATGAYPAPLVVPNTSYGYGDATLGGTYLPGPTNGYPPFNAAYVTVRLPDADAQLWFNDTLTRMQGISRRFDTPPLELIGKRYYYDLRARWKEGGRTIEQTRTVRVRPGQQLTVDFTQPSPAGEQPNPDAAKRP